MKRTAVMLTVLLLLTACVVPALAAASVSVSLPVTVRVSGKVPATAEYVSIVLEAADDANPMPGNAAGGTYKLRMRAGSESAFPEIVYTRPGTYRYTVRQNRGNVAGCTCDASLFVVDVCIAPGDDGLYPVIVVQENEGTTKLGGITFRNTYRDATPTPVPGEPEPPAPPSSGELPPTGVEDYWMLYLGGAAAFLLLAGLMVRILLRPDERKEGVRDE